MFEHGKVQRKYLHADPGCSGDSGGPLWREIVDEKSGLKVPVLVGVLSYQLWEVCRSQNPNFYGRVSSITHWINQYVPKNETCEYSHELKDHRKL